MIFDSISLLPTIVNFGHHPLALTSNPIRFHKFRFNQNFVANQPIPSRGSLLLYQLIHDFPPYIPFPLFWLKPVKVLFTQARFGRCFLLILTKSPQSLLGPVTALHWILQETILYGLRQFSSTYCNSLWLYISLFCLRHYFVPEFRKGELAVEHASQK